MSSPLFPKYVSDFDDILWNSAEEYALLCGYKKLTKKLPISELAKIFSATKSVQDNIIASIAPVFSADTAYSAGDLVMYLGKLWRFKDDHAAGDWTGIDAEEVDVETLLQETAKAAYGTNEVRNLPTSITAFRTGDVIPVDGPSGTAKMSKDDLLTKTAENSLGSIHSLSDTATEADISEGNYFVIDSANGKKKLPAEVVAKVGDFFSPTNESFLFNFVQGNAYNDGVFGPSATTRIRDDRFYSVGSFVACLAASGYKYRLFFYDSPKNVASACVGIIKFSTGKYTANDLKLAFPTAKFLRFLVANVSDTDITPNEAPSAIFISMKKISYMDATYSAEENLKDAKAKSLKVVASGFDENGEQIMRSININQFGENIAPAKDKAIYFEWGRLGTNGSNNLYLDSSIFNYKRTREFFRNNSDAIGYDGWLFGWNENKEYVGRTKYVAGSSIPVNYFWCKFVLEKFKPLNFISFSIEQGGINPEGTPIASTQRIRTADFLEYNEIKNYIVVPQSDDTGTLFIRCYSEDYSFVKVANAVLHNSAYPFDSNRTFAQLIGDATNVKYVKFAMSWFNNRNVVPSQASELFAFCTSTEENPVFGSARFLNAIEKSLNWDNGHTTIKFSYPMYIGEENYYSSGLLRLPYDYCENGKPSKIVIFVHGSASLGSLNQSNEFGYPAYVDYLTKEGYAVMDCYPNTSKYYGGDFGKFTCDWGAPVGSASYAAAFKWVCENYNIDQNRVFVTSKSQGGIGAVKLAYGYSGMKVNACAPLAPFLGGAQWGYSKYDFRIIADSCGFEGAMPDISSYSEANFRYATMPQELRDYVDANKEKLVPAMPIWFDFIDSNVAEMYEKTINGNFNTDMALKHKLSPAPIKIWVANDDINISPQRCGMFIQALRNCGMDHQLRIMPNGTGAHHAVDDGSELSLRCNITTELGYYMENLPLAWFEVVQWFRRFGG